MSLWGKRILDQLYLLFIYLLEKDKEKASVCSVETCIYLSMEPGHRGTISGGQTLARMRTNGFIYLLL